MLSLVLKYIVGPVVGAIVGRGVLEALHLFGLHPERWLARAIFNTPAAFEGEAAWIFAAVVGVVLTVAWNVLDVGGRLARLFNPQPQPSASAAGVPPASPEPMPAAEEAPAVEFVAFRNVIKITAKHLEGVVGATRYALLYEWSSGENGAFDEIEGHGVKVYSFDFDGDGRPEIIVRYHTGAHTHVLRVYKVPAPGFFPLLVPGAKIGSDWPEICWQHRKNGRGVIIEAKQRDWSAGGLPIIERYVFQNNHCVKLSTEQGV